MKARHSVSWKKHRDGPSSYSSIIMALKDLTIISAPLLALSEREVIVVALLLLHGLLWLLKHGISLRLALLWNTVGDLVRLEHTVNLPNVDVSEPSAIVVAAPDVEEYLKALACLDGALCDLVVSEDAEADVAWVIAIVCREDELLRRPLLS